MEGYNGPRFSWKRCCWNSKISYPGVVEVLTVEPRKVTKKTALRNEDMERFELMEEKQRRVRANFALLSSLEAAKFPDVSHNTHLGDSKCSKILGGN